jgi:signal transduction histidine kinase
LIFDLALNVPQVLVGDQLRIGQILLNFSFNAVKFTEKGEICIVVRIRKRLKDGIMLYFGVRDNGDWHLFRAEKSFVSEFPASRYVDYSKV